MMSERRVLDIIEAECRRRGAAVEPRSPLAEALRIAALRIAREADIDRHHAARAASIAGYAVTRGRTKL